MKKSIFIRAFAALVACALVLPVVGSSKNPVERPFKASGIVTGGSETSVDIVGTATHLGKFVSTGSFEITGVIFDGDQISKILLHVWGDFTSADGETLKLEFPEFVIDYSVTPPTSSGVAYFKGGTGRVQGIILSIPGATSTGAEMLDRVERDVSGADLLALCLCAAQQAERNDQTVLKDFRIVFTA